MEVRSFIGLRLCVAYTFHVNGHCFNHAGIDAVELLYLLCHVSALVVYLVDGADLLAGTLKLHLVHLSDACDCAVEVLHLFAVACQALALLRHLLQGLGELLQLFHIAALCFCQLGRYLLLCFHP